MRLSENEIIVDGDTCTMYLYNRQGIKNRETIFNKQFLSTIKKFRWSAYKHRNTYYVVTNLDEKQQIEYKRTRLKFHQLILPCKKPFMVDHKNHDGLDNRLENLKIVTNRQNCENRTRKNKSGYLGIHWHSRDKVWSGTIQVKGKPIHTGNFKDKKEAFKARELYKLEHKL